MAKTEINSAAAVALDYALDCVVESASPWRVPPEVWEKTWNTFAPDFDREITNLDQWLRFKPAALRLGKYIGTFAAFLAEIEGGAIGPIGDIKWEHMRLAIALVKIDCPPPGVPSVKGPLCPDVLKGKEAVFTQLHEALKAASDKLAAV